MRLVCFGLLLAALLAGCGAPAASSPTATPAQATQAPGGGPDLAPTPSATPQGAAEPAATATGTALATPTPGGEQAGATPEPATRTPVAGAPAVLPAPVYLRSSEPAQVYRIEPDAVTYAQLTFEREPVLELAVPAAAGTLFYLVGDPAGAQRTLVALDGAGRRELLTGELSGLAVSPDGQRAYVRIDNPEPGLIVGQDESPAGVWAAAAQGMRPSLVLADAPADGAYDPDSPAWAYSPIAVSPDGARLAVYAYDVDGPAIPGGELVIVGEGGALVRGPTCCEEPAWSADGASLHAAGGGPGPDVRYGLYRTDAATGAETPVLEDAAGAAVPLVVGARELADGQLYAFVELAPAEGFGWEHPFRPALARVAPDGAVTPLAPPVGAPREVLWEPGGAGALIAAYAEDLGRDDQLFWQPADGRPATLIPFAGGDMAWAPAGAPLAAGSCEGFTPVVYQEGAARRPSDAAYDVQGRLRPLGFDAGPPDGFYGERTRAAVQAFQRSRGLPATGDVDCATWQAMLALP